MGIVRSLLLLITQCQKNYPLLPVVNTWRLAIVHWHYSHIVLLPTVIEKMSLSPSCHNVDSYSSEVSFESHISCVSFY